ncbi:MAG: SRPBCC domain-containing protein [Calditrichaeota bacterium]|nr:MAG: SRPBCC domain-containing protein [Calditrichota bacterium]
MNEHLKQEEYTLKIKTEFKAPLESLFQAFTTKEYMAKWWSVNDGLPCSFIEMDFKIDGAYRFGMKDLEKNMEYIVAGRYVEIIPNSKISFTWCWEHESKEKETLVTFDFTPTKSGSELLLTHTKFKIEADKDHHTQGWSGIMETLSKFFEPIA